MFIEPGTQHSLSSEGAKQLALLKVTLRSSGAKKLFGNIEL